MCRETKEKSVHRKILQYSRSKRAGTATTTLVYTPDKTNTRKLILLAHTVLHSNNKEKLTVSSSIYSCPARYVQIED